MSFVQQDAREADFSTGTIFYCSRPSKGRCSVTCFSDWTARVTTHDTSCIHGPLLREALREFSSFSMERPRSRDDFISVFQSSPVA